LDERLYYLTDAQMNVTALLDGTPGSQTLGAAVERYAYDPYGRVTVFDGSWTARSPNASLYANEVLYCGYRLDTETGLYHVRNRVYHPLLGRWLQRDPLGYVDGMSVYEYGGGGPVGTVDPLGLWYEYERTKVEEGVLHQGQYGRREIWTASWGECWQWKSLAIASSQCREDVRFIPYPEQPSTERKKPRPMYQITEDKNLYAQASRDMTAGTDRFCRIMPFATTADKLNQGDIGGAVLSGVGDGLTLWTGPGALVKGMLAEGASEAAVGLGAPEELVNGVRTLTQGKQLFDQAKALKGVGAKASASAAGSGGAAKKSVGTYTVEYKTGNVYHGKGPPERAVQSAKRVATQEKDVPTGISYVPAEGDRRALKEEARRIGADGGPGKGNYNRIESPGKRMLEEEGE